MRTVSLSSFCAVLGLALAGLPAMAHAFLEHASPAAGDVVAAPKELTLSFSEPLTPAFSGVTVSDASGQNMEAAAPAINGAAMRVALKPLKPGSYSVAWHAVSVDTHRTEGSYKFTVKP
jgi:methionine-rich copper-binding protein CopC